MADSNSNTKWWHFSLSHDPTGAKLAKWFWLLLLLIAAIVLILRMAGCGSPVEEQLANMDYDWRQDGYWQKDHNPGKGITDDDIWTPPGDPLRRTLVRGRLNLYMADGVDLRDAAKRLEADWPDQFQQVESYANAYKRLTVSFEDPSDPDLIEALMNDPEIQFVFDEAVLSYSSSDPLLHTTTGYWWVDDLMLERCWAMAQPIAPIKVAVIDNYFDTKHPELQRGVTQTWNTFMYSDDLDLFPWVEKSSHGTHVAGLVVGERDNGEGGCGVAPFCEALVIQIGDNSGHMLTSGIVDGLFMAKNNGARVVNMSLGIPTPPSIAIQPVSDQKMLCEQTGRAQEAMWDKLFKLFADEGVVVVQSAGNEDSWCGWDPQKRSDYSIVVGASNQNNRRAHFSNFGEEVTVYAPGEGIMSSVPGDGYKEMNGTSMASPIVAGAVGMMLSVNPDLTFLEVKSLIERHADPLNDGSGLKLNLGSILDELVNQTI